jgi:hypothetical protein
MVYFRHASERREQKTPKTKENKMSQNELKIAGYNIIENALAERLYDAATISRACDEYKAQLAAHDVVTATLVQLLALSVVENA